MNSKRAQEIWTRVASSVADLLDAEAGLLVVAGRGAFGHNLPSDIPWQRPLLQACVASAEPILWEAPVGTRLANGREGGSGMAVRLMGGAEFLGVLAVLRANDKETFSMAELKRFGTLAVLQGPAIEAQIAAGTATGLLGALSQACNSREAQQLLERALDGAALALGASGASLMLLEDGGELVIRAALGLPDSVVRASRRRLGEGISGYVARSGEPLLLRGAVDDPRFQGIDPGIDGAISVPLLGSGGVLGVMKLRRKAIAATFSPNELRLALCLAQGLAGVLERVQEETRATQDRRHAVSLYEMGRLGRATGQERDTLREALDMASDCLGAHVGVLAERVGEDRWKILAGRGFDDLGEYQSEALERVLREGRALTIRRSDMSGERVPWLNGSGVHLGVPLRAGDLQGVLLVGRDDELTFGDVDMSLAEVFGMETGALWEELRRRQGEEARLAGKERKKIAQELHDSLAQELSGVLLAIEGTQLAMSRDPEAARRQLTKAVKNARECLRDVRQYLTQLRLEEEQAGSIVSALKHFVAEARKQGAPVALRADGKDVGLRGEMQRTVLRVAQEAVNNAHHHAHATKVDVTLKQNADNVTLTVEDNGIGFVAEEVVERAPTEGRYGLLGMRERAESVGGRLVVDSEVGRGTRIELVVPLANGHADEAVLELPRVETLAAPQSKPAERQSTAIAESGCIERDNGDGKPKSLFNRLPPILKR